MANSRHRLQRATNLALVLVSSLGPLGSLGAQNPAQALNAHQQLARDIYKELIEINTTTDADPGGTTKAAEAMAARLRGAGFSGADVQVLSSGPRDGNLVARLRGSRPRLIAQPGRVLRDRVVDLERKVDVLERRQHTDSEVRVGQFMV